ncbi:MAG: hypothetical protein HYU30_08820 [Chloroflexi bacterium]|nr:hypothetical protein [Chloroflexota bacterium]
MTEVFPLKEAYDFAGKRGLARQTKLVRNAKIDLRPKYANSRAPAVRRGLLTELFEKAAILDQFIVEHWRQGLQPAGKTHLNNCRRLAKEAGLAWMKTKHGYVLQSLSDAEPVEENAQRDSSLEVAMVRSTIRSVIRQLEFLEADLAKHAPPGQFTDLKGIWAGQTNFSYEDIEAAEYKLKEFPE